MFGPRTQLLLLAISTTLAPAVRPAAAQVWAVQNGTTAADYIWDLTPDGAGGVFEASETWGALAGAHQGGMDVVVTRRSHSGDILWSHQIGSALGEKATGIAADGAGGVFVAGTIHLSLPQLGRNAFVMRVDAAGSIHWVDVIDAVAGFDTWEQTFDAVEDGEGGVYAVGTTSSSVFGPAVGGASDLWIARYDASGNRLWGRQLGSVWIDEVYTVIADGAGGAVLCGQTWGALGGSQFISPPEAFYARYDSNGNLLWVRQFTFGDSSWCRSIALDGAGGYYLLGETYGPLPSGGPEPRFAFLRHVDGDGTPSWTTEIGTVVGAEARDLVVGPNGEIFASGTTWADLAGPPAGESDVWLGRFAPDGSQVSLLQFGGNDFEDCEGLASDGGTGVFVAGRTSSDLFGVNQGIVDLWIARFETCTSQPATNYCVGSPNSTGQGATIGHLGSTDLSLNDFTLTVADCPVGQVGLFILGNGQASIPLGNGVLCVSGGVSRLHPALITDTAGSASATLDVTDPSSSASQINAGETWNFQFWYRDVAAGGAGFNLSNGLSATFCP